MRKSLFLLLSTLLVSGETFSGASANLSMAGMVSSATCRLNINGLENATVSINKIPVKDLAEPGATAGKGTFVINFSGCTDVGDKVYFSFTRPPRDATDAIIPATAGSARNVGFQIENVKSGLVSFNANNTSHRGGAMLYATVTENGMFSEEYMVKYIAINTPITAGTVSSMLMVNIIYK